MLIYFLFLVRFRSRFLKNNDFIIKYEFPIFYVRNKDVYGDFYLKSRFSLSYRCSKVVRYFSSKEALHVKVYLDLKDIKTIYRENKGISGIYRRVNLKNGYTYIVSGAELEIIFLKND